MVCLLVIVPWSYFDEKKLSYIFLQRQILLVLISIVSGFILIGNFKNFFKNNLKIFGWLLFSGLGVLHFSAYQYFEKHYFLQFIFLEVASLIFIAPNSVKEVFLKYSKYIFYILILKFIFLRIGSYIHGGFNSSNLFATYIFLFLWLEFYKKAYFNILLGTVALYFIGSKAVYLGVVILYFFLFTDLVKEKIPTLLMNSYWLKFKNMDILAFVGASFLAVFLFTTVVRQTGFYKKWYEMNSPSFAESTKNNMLVYGLDKTDESLRQVLVVTRDMQFRDTAPQKTINKPMITNLDLSIGLRVFQYVHMYDNILNYFILGDVLGSQQKMLGHNPHSAVIDFISRLGVMYFILCILFYSSLFSQMKLFAFNLGLAPVLCFQPYGFTLGHSIIVLAMVYTLSKFALEKRAIV